MMKKELYAAPTTEVLELQPESALLIGGSAETRGTWDEED